MVIARVEAGLVRQTLVGRVECRAVFAALLRRVGQSGGFVPVVGLIRFPDTASVARSFSNRHTREGALAFTASGTIISLCSCRQNNSSNYQIFSRVRLTYNLFTFCSDWSAEGLKSEWDYHAAVCR